MAPAQFGAPISILGPQGQVGPQGVRGFSILAGGGAPAASLGEPGDIYVDLDAGMLYAPKTDSGWPSATRSLIGPQGAVGDTGAKGAALLNGYGPPDDALGQDGDSYFNQQAGSIYGPKSGAKWPTDAASLIGPPGGIGETGTIIYSADGPPSDTQGRDNDFYIDTMASGLYGPKLNGTWGNALSLIGPKGDRGLQGLQGLAGADGATLLVGKGEPSGGKPGDVYIDVQNFVVYGPRGDGPQPWTGPGFSFTGPQGIQGPQGPAGMVGSDGKTLLAGPVDPTDQGVDGDFYFQTTTGILYGPRTDGKYPSQGFLLKGPPGDVGAKGDTGPQGVQGPGILTGNGAPSSSLGTPGSFYIDGQHYAVYGPRGNDGDFNVWGDAVPLVGPQGPAGADSTVPGPQGIAGPRGFSVQSGQGAPPNSLGNDGDLYVDLNPPQTLYGQKVSGKWPTSGTSLTGPQGPVGAASTVPGPAGPQGYSLLTGAGAPSSSYGRDGDAYIDINAANLYGAKSSGVWPSQFVSLIGAQGPQGVQGVAGTPGTILRYGSGAPGSSTTASNGDFYIDQTNSRLYGPRANGSFGSSFVSLVGPIGIQGPPGVAGNIIASGTGAPAANVGNTGDYYIDSATGRLYGPKSASGWPTTYITLSASVPNDITANSIVLAAVSGDTAPVQVAVNNSAGVQVFLADANGNVVAAGTLKVTGTATLGAVSASTLSTSAAATVNSLQVVNTANVVGLISAGRFVANGAGSSGAPILSYQTPQGNQTGFYSDSNFGSLYEQVNGFLTRSLRYISGPPADQGISAVTHLLYSGLGGSNVCYRWYVNGSSIAMQLFGNGTLSIAGNVSAPSFTFGDGTTLTSANPSNQASYKATSAGTAAATAFGYTGAANGAGLYFDANGNVLLSVNGFKSLYSTSAAGAAAGAAGWAINTSLGAGSPALAIYGPSSSTVPVATIDGAGVVQATSATLSGALAASQGQFVQGVTLASGGVLKFGDGTTMTTAASGTGSSGGGTAGPAGSQLRYGTGAPSANYPAVQNDGDSYIDQQNSFLYGPRANGTWPTPPISLIGPIGPAGTFTRSVVYMGTFWNTSAAANTQYQMQQVVQSGSTVGQTPAVYVAVRPGSVTGYSFNQVGPVSGAYTLYVLKNNTVIATFPSIGSGIKGFSASIAAGTYTFVAGDVLSVNVSTSGSGNLQSTAHLEITTA